MKKLITLLLLFVAFKSFGQGIPTNQVPAGIVQLTTNTQYLDPATGNHWVFNGNTYLWWNAGNGSQQLTAPNIAISDSSLNIVNSGTMHRFAASLAVYLDTSVFINTGTISNPYSIKVASASQAGVLSATDWSRFNAGGGNIYNIDGTFTASRTGKLNGNSLTIYDDLYNSVFLNLAPSSTTPTIYLGTATSTLQASNTGIALTYGSGGSLKSIALNSGSSNGIIVNDANNIGFLYGSNYTTNQRAKRLSVPSVNTVIALADSVKATISSGGTVSTISGVNTNGFTWSITNPTTTPAITLTLQNATSSLDGKLSHTDWSTFNGKQAALISGTNIKTINSTSILGSGNISVQAPLTFQNGLYTDFSGNINWGGSLISGGGGVSLDQNGEQVQFSDSKYNSIQFQLQPSATLPQASFGVNTGSIVEFIDFQSTRSRWNFYNGANFKGVELGIASAGVLITDQIDLTGTGYGADYHVNGIANYGNRWIPDAGWVNAQIAASGGGGTVSSISIVSANGFGGTVATATTTPAITLTTSITGIIKGNGTALSSAIAGTDYLTPTGSAALLTSFPTLNQNTTGSAATLTTARTIQGVSFNGSANINIISGTGFVKATGTTLSYDNSTYITGNQTITLSGDFTGSGTTSIAGTLATVNSGVGSFTNPTLTVNAKGLITAVSNTTGAATSTTVTNETPGGAINSSNVTFTLANTPVTGSLQLYKTGILQNPGAGNDYTISGNTITYNTAPVTGQILLATYQLASTTGALTSLSLTTDNVIYSTPVSFTNTLGVGAGALALKTQTARFMLGNHTGSTAAPTFAALTNADLPTIAYSNGGSNSTTSWTQGSILFAGASAFAQDNANLFWDATNHRLGIGTTTPLAQLEVVSTISTIPRGIISDQFSTDAIGGRETIRKARGTTGSLSTIVTGDVLGSFTAEGYDGSGYFGGVKILGTATGTISSGIVPGIMELQTANTSGTFADGIKIDQAQQITFGGYSTTGIAHLSSSGVLTSSLIALADLSATGTPSSTTYLRGDNTWATITGGGSGTVTSVSITTANGVSGSVATSTTTPAITLTLGAITPTTVNGNTFTTGTYILTGGAGKTLTFNNTLTISNTDGITMTTPTTSFTAARTDAAQTFIGVQTMASPTITGTANVAGISGTANITTNGGSFSSTKAPVSGTTINTIGLEMKNSTAATSGVPNQFSTVINWEGRVWNTSGTPAQNQPNFFSGMRTTSGTTPTAKLYWSGGISTTIGTASTADLMTLDATTGTLAMLVGTIQLKGFTVATLPTGVTGMTAYVTDALTPSFGTTLVGGGTIVTKAFYNGTNWIAE